MMSNCNLGTTRIAVTDSIIYGGILLTHNLFCKARIEKYCQKARQHINSLRSLGLSSNGLHPMSSVKIWLRMILTTSFYGCELLYDIKGQHIDVLEST